MCFSHNIRLVLSEDFGELPRFLFIFPCKSWVSGLLFFVTTIRPFEVEVSRFSYYNQKLPIYAQKWTERLLQLGALNMVSKYALFAAVAVAASYLVGNGVLTPPQFLTFGHMGTFLEGFLLQFVVWAFYSVLLKHRFSSMRNLPGPKVREALSENPLP